MNLNMKENQEEYLDLNRETKAVWIMMVIGLIISVKELGMQTRYNHNFQRCDSKFHNF